MSITQRSLSFYLSLIGFFAIFSTTISKNPVLPLFIKNLGGPDYILGIIAAASPFAGIVFSFPVGYLADRLGKKRLLVFSAFIFVLAPLLYLLVSHPLLLIPIRFFHGLATAISGPIITAIIVSSFPQSKGEKLGIYSSATLFGRTLAPLVGGFILYLFASFGGLLSFRLVYFFAFLLSLPVLFISFQLPSSTAISISQLSFFGLISELKYYVFHRILFFTSLVEMATYFIYGVLEAYLPVYLAAQGISASFIGLLFSVQVVSIALTKPFFGRLADRINKRVQILAGISLLVFTVFLIPYLSNYFLLLIDVLFFGFGMSLSTVATSTYVSDNVSSSKQATSMGLLSSIMDIGQTSGPFVVGFLVSSFSYNFGFNFSASLGLICALLFFFFSRK